MAICEKCGKEMDDDVKFCPSCGTATTNSPQAGQTDPTAQPADTTAQPADPNDAQQNKTMAIIAYILFFVPLLTGDAKKSPFVKFHTNQGTVLFLACTAAMVVSSILMVVLIGAILLPLCSLAVLALCIIGIINAANGKTKPLPVIGKFTIIK